jgi:hypothetical protein
MNMLDIGGGFTGTEIQLEEVNFFSGVDYIGIICFLCYMVFT